MLQQVVQCIILAKCDDLAQQLPPGGGILAGISIVLVILVTPMLREKPLAWLKHSWQAMLALVCGAVAFLIDGHISTFLVAGLTALLCLLALNARLALVLGHRLNKIPGIQRLSGLTVPNFILISGIAIYLLTFTGLRIHETYKSEQLVLLDDDVLVVFALPVVDNSAATTSAKYQAEIRTIERQLFDRLRGTVAFTFKGIDDKADVLPDEVIAQSYERLKSEFPSFIKHRTTLIHKLEAYRKGDDSPVDLVLLTIFSFVPDQNRLRCRFRLYELATDPVDLQKIDWEAEINILPDEIQRATLFAGARLAMHVADRNSNLVKGDEQRLWEALLTGFREYYDLLDNYREQRDQDWAGHKLWNDSQCQGRKCVAEWMQAYSSDEMKPDEMARERLDSKARRVILPIVNIAEEGADS